MTRRRRRAVKRGETDLVSNQFPKCSPQPRTPRDSQSEVEKRRGKEEKELTWERKGRVKRGESNLASNQFCMSSPQPGTPREVHRVTWRREEG